MVLMVPYVLFNSQVMGASEDMYLFSPAIEGTPLYWWVIGLLAVALYTIFLLIYEQFALKKEDRFLNTTFQKLKNWRKKKEPQDEAKSA